MPSKFVSRTFVREEAARAAKEAKREIIEHISKLQADLTATNFDAYSDIETQLGLFRHDLVSLRSILTTHDEKLGMLIEGGVRNMVKCERGEEWVRGVVLHSASDFINYVAIGLGEGSTWRNRATSQVIDVLKSTDAVKRVVILIQNVLLDSSGDSWKEMKCIVLQKPLVISGEVCAKNIAALIHPAPLYMRNTLRSIYVFFNATRGNTQNFMDYAQFILSEASFMCLSMLAEDDYELTECELPPHKLEFDCAGSLRISGDEIILDGGEIKSSSSSFPAAEKQLNRRFKLIAFIAPIIYSNIKLVTADGYSYAPRSRQDVKNDRLEQETMGDDSEVDGILSIRFHRQLITYF